MKLEFFEPSEAAALMKCSESWLRQGAVDGRFPHAVWGKGKIVFTSEHLEEIARISQRAARPAAGPQQRVIGTRAARRAAG